MRDVKGFLSAKQSEDPALADQWAQLQQLYEKRLWHELTVELLKFVKVDTLKKKGGLLELYENFIADFEHRINPLSLTEIILVIVQEIKDHDKAVEFVQKTQERVKMLSHGNKMKNQYLSLLKVKHTKEANVLCLTTIATIRLQQGKLDEVKKITREAQAELDTIDGVTSVHGRFYDLSSNYWKITGSYNDYYRDALRFLGCMNLADVPDLQQRAFNLALAALLGNEVYNFGELLAHPVLEYLKKSEYGWLVELLLAFNSGDIEKFKNLRPQWQGQADLAANETNLAQKIMLLSLMELAFKRPSTDRTIPFTVIAETAKLPVDEVELLVMKALSVGLIKGSIDEVDQVVIVTWVQPRVLDATQITRMKELLSHWCEKVKSSAFMIEDQVPELLVT